ncbi:MAG: ATP synthase subunit I [Clostridiales bacterium]|nr:ATP synthase subunit I [Clostridiales bacterium]
MERELRVFGGSTFLWAIPLGLGLLNLYPVIAYSWASGAFLGVLNSFLLWWRIRFLDRVPGRERWWLLVGSLLRWVLLMASFVVLHSLWPAVNMIAALLGFLAAEIWIMAKAEGLTGGGSS